jgi:hypothetical protein
MDSSKPPVSGDFGAYGSSGATGEFDPKLFVKKPQVILRIVGWVFSLIVFSCISSQGWEKNQCLYNGDAGACGYGTAIGVLTFFVLLVFLGLDAVFDNLSNAQHRRYIVMADIACSGLLSFLWFVCFCYLTAAWKKTNFTDNPYGEAAWQNKSGIEAAIAFSFFSIGICVALTVLAVLRYRKGVSDGSAGGYGQQSYGDPSVSPF